MKLNAFSVTNYKSIRETASVGPLTTLNALIGPNNEGKTSLLECLYSCNDFINHRHGDFEEWRAYISERFVDKSISAVIELELEFELSEEDAAGIGITEQLDIIASIVFRCSWGLQLGRGTDPSSLYPTYIALHLSDGRETVLASVPDGESWTLDFANVGPTPDQLAGSRQILTHSEVISGLRNGSRQENPSFWTLGLLRAWALNSVWIPSHRKVSLIGQTSIETTPIDDNSLPGILDHMRRTRESQYDDFETLLSELVPSVGRVYTHPESENTVSLRVSAEGVPDTKDAFRLDTVGGGFNELLYLAAVIWLSPDGCTLIIEEPERGLHARSQRILRRAALKHARETGKQLLWATHSTAMAPFIPDCSVHLIRIGENGSTQSIAVGREESGEVLEALGQSNVDLYQHDLVVLWDGESESSALLNVASHLLGQELFSSVLFQPLRGDLRSKRELVAQFIRLLTDTGTPMVLILDDDERVQETLTDFERRFTGQSAFSVDRVYVWKCGVKEETDQARGAEFEDNFSYDELVTAANRLGEGGAMSVEGLAERVTGKPGVAISKLLDGYFHDCYGPGWSKPGLNALLGILALEKIKSSEPRGKANSQFEFEGVIMKLRELLPG